jgi:hypothetical protein
MSESLTALIDGDRGEIGQTGSMLLAEGLANLRVCAEFAMAYAKAMRKGAR